MKVYIVCGSITCNPLFADWIAAVYSCEQAAKSHCEAAQFQANLLCNERDAENCFDREAGDNGVHRDTRYAVMEFVVDYSFLPNTKL